MNIKEAINCMKDGKKVKRANDNFIYYYKDDKIYCEEAKWKYDNNSISYEDVLAEDWEVIEDKKKEKKKYWIPKKDEKYYFVSSFSSNVSYDKSIEDEFDESRINLGNCFRTEEEAVHMIKKSNIIHELQKFAYENNSEEISQKWQLDDYRKKYYIVYNYVEKQIKIGFALKCRSLPFNIYFESEEEAKKAIETIGEDRIKKYYFDVEK